MSEPGGPSPDEADQAARFARQAAWKMVMSEPVIAVTFERGRYLTTMTAIEGQIASMVCDLVAADDVGEELLRQVLLDRVPGGDRLGLFDALRQALGIKTETRGLSTRLAKVTKRRNDYAHQEVTYERDGPGIYFGRRPADKATLSEVQDWNLEAMAVHFEMRALHARLVYERRPERARPWMARAEAEAEGVRKLVNKAIAEAPGATG
jgi:hypothetical protein